MTQCYTNVKALFLLDLILILKYISYNTVEDYII